MDQDQETLQPAAEDMCPSAQSAPAALLKTRCAATPCSSCAPFSECITVHDIAPLNNCNSTEEVPRPVTCAPQQHQRESSSYNKGTMQGYGSRGHSGTDTDAVSLVGLLSQHMEAMTHDAVEHLLSVKASMITSLETAVAAERDTGASKLVAKEVEVNILKAELQDTRKQLNQTDRHLQRVCDAYAAKQEQVLDTRCLLSSWYKWRVHIARQRRHARQALKAEHYYVQRWLLGRAWDRWAGRARSHYRQLVTQRAEHQREAEAAALTAVHRQAVDVLKVEIGLLQQQLQQEAAARNKMEDEMKRAFMRGVTAINLEAVQIMRRGAPPSGSNPFPVTTPLNATTAASGLANVQQHHQQRLGYQMQQQELLQLQQEHDEQAATEAAQGTANARNPGTSSCCSSGQAVQPTAAEQAAACCSTSTEHLASAEDPAQGCNLTTWTSVPGAAAGIVPARWAVSNSSSTMSVPQSAGDALPKVVIERGPAAAVGRARSTATANGVSSSIAGKVQRLGEKSATGKLPAGANSTGTSVKAPGTISVKLH